VTSPIPSTSSTPVPTVAPSPVVHVVKSGESLTSIAALYGVTPQSIRRANNLKDANLLRVGQRLVIPIPNGPAAG
jgi:N-acetylmuramoyl-L-alanine amidase